MSTILFSITSKYITQTGGGAPVITTTGWGATVNDAKEKTSVDTGSFTPGIYRVNPYHVKKTMYTPTTEVCECKWTVGTTKFYASDDGCIGGKILQTAASRLPLISSASLESRALSKAYSKVGAAAAGIGEDLGEYRETLEMLRNPLKAFRDFLDGDVGRSLRRVNSTNFVLHPNGTVSAGKALASTWLEFKLGLVPLLKSIGSLVDLAKKKGSMGGLNTIRSKHGTEETENSTSSSYNYGYHKLQYKTNIAITDSIRCSAAVQYRYTGVMPDLLDDLGLSPQFWPETAFALTRLSFVVDWWFNVSTWLGAHRFNLSVERLGHTVSTKVTRKLTATGDWYCYWSGGSDSGAVTSFGEYTVEELTRTCGQSPPLTPALVLKPLNAAQTATAIALLLQSILSALQNAETSALKEAAIKQRRLSR